jgi:plasmid stabilization system protein ParE
VSSARFLLQLSPAAERDRSSAEVWWEETHGPLAPSRLVRELAHAFDLLEANPRLGFPGRYRGRPVLKYPLACNFFLVYKVRPRRREVVILRILAASRLHG